MILDHSALDSDDGERSDLADVDDCFISLLSRICPGKEIADTSLFITIAVMIAVLRIEKAVDALENEITPSLEVTNGLIRLACVYSFL